jgi:hypothetical protein
MIEYRASLDFKYGTVLAHHDDGSCVSGLKGERQIQQDEGIGVPVPQVYDDVQNDPDDQKNRLDDDKAP